MKFISIIDFYSANVEGMLPKQNYHLLPIQAAINQGLETELWVLQPNHPNKGNLPDNIKIRTFPNTIKYLLALLKEKDSIIYANTRIWKTMIACFFGKKTIFMSHTTEPPKKHKRVFKWFMKHFDIIRAVNQSEKDNLTRLGIKPDKIRIIPHAIDFEFWKHASQDRNGTVVTTANVRSVKNIPVIEKACELAGKELVVIGENMEQTSQFATGKKTPEQIRTLLQRAVVYVNSSDSEGMCLSVYEAIAAGLPVCLPNLSTFKNLRALFHNPKDVEQLAKNIQQQIGSPIYQDDGMTMYYDNVLKKFEGVLQDCKI